MKPFSTSHTTNDAQSLVTDKILPVLTQRRVFGKKGYAVLALVFFVAVTHFVVLWKTSGRFKHWRSHFYAVSFASFTLIFLFLSIYFLVRWRAIAEAWILQELQVHSQQKEGDEPAPVGADATVLTFKSALRWKEDIFSINGKYHLVKVAVNEVVEDWWQFYVWRRVHLWTLGIEYTSAIGVFLLLETGYRCFAYRKFLFYREDPPSLSMQERDLQILADTVVDLLLLLFPLILSISGGDSGGQEEYFTMLLVPTLSLFPKALDLMEDTIKINLADYVEQAQQMKAIHDHRSKTSLYGDLSYTAKVEKMQNDHFPLYAKRLVWLNSVVFGILFASTLVLQWFQYDAKQIECATTFGPGFWEGCEVPVLYATRMFVPTCNCADLKLPTEDHPGPHNFTLLPTAMSDLTALRSLTIRGGQLRNVSDDVLSNKLNRLQVIDFSFNALERFDVATKDFKKLTELYLHFNALKHIHKDVWKHPALEELTLNSNVGIGIPEDTNLPALTMLDIQNNSVAVPATLGTRHFPSIISLFLSGNDMSKLPNEFNEFKLQNFAAARCGLTKIERGDIALQNLRFIDLRNNNLTTLDLTKVLAAAKNLNTENLLLNGNPVCKRKQSVANVCDALCSPYCMTRENANLNIPCGGEKVYNDRNIYTCNAPGKCNYAFGKCSKSN